MRSAFFVLLLFAMWQLTSCGDASYQQASEDTSTVTGSQMPAPVDTMELPKPVDSMATAMPFPPPAEPQRPKQAVFGYSYFKNIRQHETRNVNAYVSILNQVSEVIDTLRDINSSDIPERNNDTATIVARNIFVYKALTVTLVNAGDSDFVIRSFADSRQLIDSADGNSWTWAVTPRTSKRHGRMVMSVIAEKPDGSHEPFSTVNIPIDIQLDKAINRTIWQWMMDNPEKVLTIILIPLIIFFWKQISSVFKKKNPPPTPGNQN